jgi:site-specific DNA-cytosine methylase
LVVDCRRVLNWEEKIAPVQWEEFFRVRGVDYRGDEILSAQSIQWENVAPALPDEVGAVDLEKVVELGSLEYVCRFPEFLLDPEDQVYIRPPRVMVAPEHWEELCEKLLQKGVFARIHEDDIHRVDGKLILNGLFGVSKHEFVGEFEVMRIIMNLIPANRLVRGLDSDIATLPTWASMSPLCLMPHEDLVISSEDVRCFFYIFKLPLSWHPLMAFNRPLPPKLCGDRAGRWFPCSAVLPMGFKNSVALAQHIHRLIAKKALVRAGLGSELEARKDRTFSVGNPLYRIYLDNFDELRRVSKGMAALVAGEVSPLVSGLREEYALLGVPRHPKKSVSSQLRAEVQGAIVDGQEGIAFPKPEKVLRYAFLSLQLLKSGRCSQKQAQVVGGGLVYLAMFRRPPLGSLNSLWKFILEFDSYPPVIQLPLPKEVKLELARFIGLIPLAYMDFRSTVSRVVTASDASKSGGGVTASVRVTPAGCVAAQCPVRGDILEPTDMSQVLTIGLFDGIGALRAAVDALGWCVLGHVSVEKDDQAARVVEARFPHTVRVKDVLDIDENMVKAWALQFSQAALVVIGAGPPCQGVSGLNAARKGALKDARSSLFVHVSRVRSLVKRFFPWAQVRAFMESVGSMDYNDREIMSEDFGERPWLIDASGVSLARRPRFYWVDWELVGSEGAEKQDQSCKLHACLKPDDFLLPGWKLYGEGPLPTFTTSRPREAPGYKPAGLAQCLPEEITRWKEDRHRFPPYQYRVGHCLVNRDGKMRLPNIEEREVIMGFPRNYTVMCMGKQQQGTTAHVDCRLSLVGNSWNVTVVAWILSQLGAVLGLNPILSTQEVVQRTSPGSAKDFQTFLQRPLMRPGRQVTGRMNEEKLVTKLLTLVGVKGEDLMLQASSEDQVKYHRLRASVPAKLWKWRTITGWKWRDQNEHINVLEMRAVFTALRWRIEKQQVLKSKFVHLLDSLVCLHALSRGRSSSRKLKRSLLRINALLLATNCHPVWAYVHTKENPADAPSRGAGKRKWCNA